MEDQQEASVGGRARHLEYNAHCCVRRMFLNPPLPLFLLGPLFSFSSPLQLREEFDRGVDVPLDEEHSVHDVAALLKEFLRDMPDPLLTKELYTAFISTTCELYLPLFFPLWLTLILLFLPSVALFSTVYPLSPNPS